MRFTLAALVAFLAVDATSAAPGRLRPGGTDDRHLQDVKIDPVGQGFTDRGGKPPPASEAPASYGMPEPSARSANALPSKERTLLVGLSGACAKGSERRCCATLARRHGGNVEDTWEYARACSIRVGAGRAGVASFAGDPEVGSVDENKPVYATSVPSWGLDRINQRGMPLDSQAEKVNAGGTRVYVLDTGVQGSHVDFDGLMSDDSDCHKNFSDDGSDPQTDSHGHGTHVASTACGHTYGVAEGCEICAVQVLGSNGRGSYAMIISGINHVAANCPEGMTCVANLSLGGTTHTPVDNAINKVVEAGMVMVVAAGNDNDDACNYSPAGAELAITVGSTTKTSSGEGPSGFSNYGSCVDVYDPGSSITAAWIGDSNDNHQNLSGTSMASPHAAGIAAGAIGEGHATSPAEVRALLVENWDNPGIDYRYSSSRTQGLATTYYAPLTPTPPPVPPTPTPGNPPAIEVAHADTFTFTPVSACLGAGALGASGTTAGQCAQACAVLEDCLGFEVFRTATDDFDEGDCVLSGDVACAEDDGAVWYYARSVSN